MSSYISSFANRLYAVSESQYGVPVSITAGNRISNVQLAAQQAPVPVRRRDKTGSRTFVGLPGGLRTETSFQLRTYLTSWNGTGQPASGPLFQAALGASPQMATALVVASALASQIRTTTPHGLSIGSAVSFAGEIRFVNNLVDQSTFQTNAPFTAIPPNGSQLAGCITYKLSDALPSVSIYDYWCPSDAVSRIITGAAVNQFEVNLNGDFHEFLFAGPACDLLDSSTFTAGTAGMAAFPSEPALSAFDDSIVPGHLGEVWLGNTPNQFFSVTAAKFSVTNHLQLRAREFGASKPLGVVPGPRQVQVDFSLLAYDDAATTALYSAAKQRNPISAMLQLGQQQGRVMAVYVPSVTPEIPLFEDSDVRLQWHFRNCLASGVSNDELYLAFA